MIALAWNQDMYNVANAGGLVQVALAPTTSYLGPPLAYNLKRHRGTSGPKGQIPMLRPSYIVTIRRLKPVAYPQN